MVYLSTIMLEKQSIENQVSPMTPAQVVSQYHRAGRPFRRLPGAQSRPNTAIPKILLKPGRRRTADAPDHRHALMMGYADREHGLLARSRALRTKPGFGGQHEAGRALPRHKSRHKRKRALIARTTRAAMLEVLQQDYIRTARAKGIGQIGILFVHALKNAAVPIVTVIGLGVALLIGGAVVTETVFAIPGVGRLTVDAILRRDYPVIPGVVLLFSFVYVIVNLLIDLLYTVLDPRIRY
jgi:hypothetical protein